MTQESSPNFVNFGVYVCVCSCVTHVCQGTNLESCSLDTVHFFKDRISHWPETLVIQIG